MRSPSVITVLFLGCVLAMPVAQAATDAPLRQEAARGEAHPEGARGPEVPSTPESSDDKAPPKPGASGKGGTRLPGMSGVPAEAGSDDVPLTAGTWVAHGGLVLLPLGGAFGASLVGGDTRPGAIAAKLAAGMLLGSQPAKLLFIRPAAPSRARWMELEVASFGAGLVLTPPLAALGTWGLGELAFGGSRYRGDAYLGALGGAAAGALLGVAAHALLTKLAGPSSRLETERGLIALGFIGAGATVGYQWAGGGPRPR
jgi:hypothetical protein